MANSNSIFVGWNRAVAGRERQTIEHFQEFLSYLGKQQQSGNITSYTPCFLNAHGGDLNGFVLVTGDSDKLHRLTGEDSWNDHVARASAQMNGFGVIPAVTGNLIEDRMKRFAKYL